MADQSKKRRRSARINKESGSPYASRVAEVALSLFEIPTEIPILGLKIPYEEPPMRRSRPPTTRGINFPHRVYTDRPLEIELSAEELGAGAGVELESTARSISVRARLEIVVVMSGRRKRRVSAQLSLRPSLGFYGWVARVLLHPSQWAEATRVQVVSLSLAGRRVRYDCLPATLRVGYNHAPAPAGAVISAAKDGNMPALRDALDAGGSTEEKDEDDRTACFHAAFNGRLEALRALIAAGADPDVADRAEVTPLHAAVERNHPPVVKLLLKSPGVDPLALRGSWTPLECALNFGNDSAAAELRASKRVAEELVAIGAQDPPKA